MRQWPRGLFLLVSVLWSAAQGESMTWNGWVLASDEGPAHTFLKLVYI
jgi:hypothetical protein